MQAMRESHLWVIDQGKDQVARMHLCDRGILGSWKGRISDALTQPPLTSPTPSCLPVHVLHEHLCVGHPSMDAGPSRTQSAQKRSRTTQALAGPPCSACARVQHVWIKVLLTDAQAAWRNHCDGVQRTQHKGLRCRQRCCGAPVRTCIIGVHRQSSTTRSVYILWLLGFEAPHDAPALIISQRLVPVPASFNPLGYASHQGNAATLTQIADHNNASTTPLTATIGRLNRALWCRRLQRAADHTLYRWHQAIYAQASSGKRQQPYRGTVSGCGGAFAEPCAQLGNGIGAPRNLRLIPRCLRVHADNPGMRNISARSSAGTRSHRQHNMACTSFVVGQPRGAGRRRASAPRHARSSQFVGCRAVNCVDRIGTKSSNATFQQAVRRYGVDGSKILKGTSVMMFERFTEKAIKVVMLAQEESRRLGHNFVGTEQILLGLIGESTGISAKVLKSMGVTLKEARTEVEKVIGRGSGFVAVEIPFTPRAKRVLELSLDEARQLGAFCPCCGSLLAVQALREKSPLADARCCRAGHSYIGTEHILLGLLREGEGIAARVLETMGAEPAKIRNQVRPEVALPQARGWVVEHVSLARSLHARACLDACSPFY